MRRLLARESRGACQRLLAVLSCCVVVVSCEGGRTAVANPSGPTPTTVQRPPSAPLYPPDSWALTVSTTAVTPHPCFRDAAGRTFDYVLSVRRADPMRLFVYWDPTDGIEYNGSLVGPDFSLAGIFNRGIAFSLGCLSGGQIEVILSGRVSGRFADDGRSLSAEEVISYLLVSTNERVEIRYRWAATAPER